VVLDLVGPRLGSHLDGLDVPCLQRVHLGDDVAQLLEGLEVRGHHA
jgi:hypothetical protein